MFKIKENLAILLHPSYRGRAFIQNMIKKKILPNEIFLMEHESVSYEDYKGSTDNLLFNPNEKTTESIKNININYKIINSVDCNSNLVIDAIKNINSKWIIYSGGGILKKEVLSQGKKFIHIHPGKLPEYRGSTCFYYSIIDKGYCYCTAFIMDEKLDSGKILLDRQFFPPKNVDFDTIFDPWMRSETLCELLEAIDFEKEVKYSSNSDLASNMYYVIHPVLKHISIGINNA